MGKNTKIVAKMRKIHKQKLKWGKYIKVQIRGRKTMGKHSPS